MIVFFYALESILTFRGKIRKRTVAISLLLSEKKDVLLSMYSLIESQNLLEDEKTKDITTQVRWLQTAKLKTSEIENTISTLSSLQKRLFLFANEDSLKNNDDFIAYMDMAKDLDANYRKSAAIFNSDLLGYEYWRKTPLFRLLFFIFGFKKVNRLP